VPLGGRKALFTDDSSGPVARYVSTRAYTHASTAWVRGPELSDFTPSGFRAHNPDVARRASPYGQGLLLGPVPRCEHGFAAAAADIGWVLTKRGIFRLSTDKRPLSLGSLTTLKCHEAAL
jgi:hypothetical protein